MSKPLNKPAIVASVIAGVGWFTALCQHVRAEHYKHLAKLNGTDHLIPPNYYGYEGRIQETIENPEPSRRM